MRTGFGIACVLALLCLAGAQQGESARQTPSLAWAETPDAELSRRLAELDPSSPMAYFELGEEVVSSFPGGEGYRLARERFALAYALDAERTGEATLARSAALAIAEVTPDPGERRWLLTMAGALRTGETRASVDPELRRQRLQAAEVLSMHRGGEFRRVRPLLMRIDLEQVLRDAGMDRDEARTLVDRVASDAENLIDEERTDTRTRRDEELEPHPRNGGNPGPALGPEAYLRSLRAELLLVGGEPGSWSADLVVRGGTAARDLDPAELLTITGVDPSRARWSGGNDWRTGGWVVR